MPFKSKAQVEWAHTPEGTKALGGKAAVDEWDKETADRKLPERKAPPRHDSQSVRMRHTARPR